MSKPNHALTKTCINCGLQKPLSAFLQFSATHGATYGNVCASCRKSQQEKADHKESGEKTRRETSGSKIRASERLAIEISKKEHREKVDALNREEQKKDEQQLTERTQKTEIRVKSEKTHRESLKQRSFLDRSDRSKSAPAREQIFGSEAHRAEEGKIRLDVPFVGEDFTKEKYKSSIFRQFKDWLGTSAPIVTAAERAQKKPNTSGAGSAEAEGNREEKNEQESLADYVKKTWGPGGR